jgi:hypothetical protein
MGRKLLNDGDCSLAGCITQAYSKGLCRRHYNAMNYQRRRDLERMSRCRSPGCEKQHVAIPGKLMLCAEHYHRFYGEHPPDSCASGG